MSITRYLRRVYHKIFNTGVVFAEDSIQEEPLQLPDECVEVLEKMYQYYIDKEEPVSPHRRGLYFYYLLEKEKTDE